jgi:hypothetical protein
MQQGRRAVRLIESFRDLRNCANFLEWNMGILDKLEEVAGAIVAVEGLKMLDPNASTLSEIAAAVTGYKGTELLKDKLEQKEDGGEAAAPSA